MASKKLPWSLPHPPVGSSVEFVPSEGVVTEAVVPSEGVVPPEGVVTGGVVAVTGFVLVIRS